MCEKHDLYNAKEFQEELGHLDYGAKQNNFISTAFMQLLNIAMENERKGIDTAFTVGDTFSNSRSYLNNWGAKSTR